MFALRRPFSLSVAVFGLLAAAPVQADILHRWSFDTAADSVGGANLTLVGTAGLTGGQLVLPGGGGVRANYASVPISGTLSSLQSMTVESWFTLTGLTNWSKLWMFGTAGAEPALAYVDYTPFTGLGGNIPKIDFDPANGPTEANTSAGANPLAPTTNTLYYVATVYDAPNNLMSFYINGTLADSASMNGGNISQLGTTAQNFIGAAVNFGDPDLAGKIDEMRIWGNPLSASEISQHNTLGVSVVPEPASGLLAMGAAAGLTLLRRRRR
jgi:MYXO-CTERM domain-containing protein